jgi:hypothetical protein
VGRDGGHKQPDAVCALPAMLKKHQYYDGSPFFRRKPAPAPRLSKKSEKFPTPIKKEKTLEIQERIYPLLAFGICDLEEALELISMQTNHAARGDVLSKKTRISRQYKRSI